MFVCPGLHHRSSTRWCNCFFFFFDVATKVLQAVSDEHGDDNDDDDDGDGEGDNDDDDDDDLYIIGAVCVCHKSHNFCIPLGPAGRRPARA